MTDSSRRVDRVLLHLAGSRRVAVGPEEVYYLEAAGDDTVVRKRGRRPLRDARPLPDSARRAIPIDPKLLVAMDRHRRQLFVEQWRTTFATERED